MDFITEEQNKKLTGDYSNNKRSDMLFRWRVIVPQ